MISDYYRLYAYMHTYRQCVYMCLLQLYSMYTYMYIMGTSLSVAFVIKTKTHTHTPCLTNIHTYLHTLYRWSVQVRVYIYKIPTDMYTRLKHKKAFFHFSYRTISCIPKIYFYVLFASLIPFLIYHIYEYVPYIYLVYLYSCMTCIYRWRLLFFSKLWALIRFPRIYMMISPRSLVI